jgi:hypothetical protein
VVGVCLLGFSVYQDQQDSRKRDQALCEQLRADPHCIESEVGFKCDEKASLRSFSTMKICESKLSPEERHLRNEENRQRLLKTGQYHVSRPSKRIPNPEYVRLAVDTYSAIVKNIIESENPQELDYETKLAAIYNCINDEHEDNLKAEAYASIELHRLVVTPEQQERYLTYHTSKGRKMNPGFLVPALLAGEKSLDCAYLRN